MLYLQMVIKFAPCSRIVHANGTKLTCAKFLNFSKFSVRRGTHAGRHTSRTSSSFQLYAMARSKACKCHSSFKVHSHIRCTAVSLTDWQ